MQVFNMSEMGTTGGVTALRALSLAMSVLGLISWGGFAFGVNALRDSPAAVESASGRLRVRHDQFIVHRDEAKAHLAIAREHTMASLPL